MSTSNNGKDQEMEAPTDEEEQEQQQSVNNGAASSTRKQKQQRQQQAAAAAAATPTRRSTRKRRAASPTNGAESDENEEKPTKKRSRTTTTRRGASIAAIAEEEDNDEDMQQEEDNDDDNEPKKKAAKTTSSKEKETVDSDEKMTESSPGNGSKKKQNEQESSKEEEEEDSKMPAAAEKVNGNHHATATTTTEATSSSSATTTTSVAAAAATAAAAPATVDHNNLRLPYQHTPGKPLNETEILRHRQPPPPGTSSQEAGGGTMRLHLEASSTTPAASPYPIPTPQPPRGGRELAAAAGLKENGGLAATTASAAGGGGGEDDWFSPTAAQQQQQQAQQQQGVEVEDDAVDAAVEQLPKVAAAISARLLQFTIVWCILVFTIHVALGRYKIYSVFSSVADDWAKPTIGVYKRTMLYRGQDALALAGPNVLPFNETDVLTAVGVDVNAVTAAAAASSTNLAIPASSDEKEEVVAVVVTDDEIDDDDGMDDATLDMQLKSELEVEEKEEPGPGDDDDESVWLRELHDEQASVNDFEIDLPEEEPDDFGIEEEDEHEFNIANINMEQDEAEFDIPIKDLLEQEMGHEEDDEEEDLVEEGNSTVYNVTDKTNLMRIRLDSMQGKSESASDTRHKIRRDLESQARTLAKEENAFLDASDAMDNTLDGIGQTFASSSLQGLKSKNAEMDALWQSASAALEDDDGATEPLAGSEALEAFQEHLGMEYGGFLIDISTLELWSGVIHEEEEECSSDEFAFFTRDHAVEYVDEFRSELEEESDDIFNNDDLQETVVEWVKEHVHAQPMPTREKLKSIETKAKPQSASQNGPSPDAIKHMIAARLDYERADQTGRVDYAALYNGASVIRSGEHATSPSLVDSLPIVNRLAATFRLRFHGHGPEAALIPTHPSTALGQCWAFGPDSKSQANGLSTFASFSIKLSKPLFVERVSIEHPSTLLVKDKVRTAIRSFRVLGFEDDDAQGEAWTLGSFVYEVLDDRKVNNRARLRQEFEIPEEVDGEDVPQLRSISLAIDSNWGMPYSCLYRVRVHGSER